MAARHADSSRHDRDRGRYEPPRRDDRDRDRERRDDRHTDRYSGGRDRRDRDDRDRVRSDRPRDWDRRGRRDERRDGDSFHRRSRSPHLHDGRYEDRYRRDRNNDRDRDRRSASYRPDSSRASATPAPDSRRAGHPPAREERKVDPEQEKQNKQRERIARMAEWKKQIAKEKGTTPSSAASPTGTAPATPTAAAPPPTAALAAPPTPPAGAGDSKHPLVKAKDLLKNGAEKTKQKLAEKSTFKLDKSAAARPLMAKPVGKLVTTATRTPGSTKLPKTNTTFGLKAKSASEQETSKKTFLDDDDDTGKRKLKELPAFIEQDLPEHADDVDGDDDAAMSDIEDEPNEQVLAQLEKRRADLANEQAANEDSVMEEVPPAAQASEAMDVDQTAGAAEAEEPDALEAFMEGVYAKVLVQPSRGAVQGQTLYNDDLEPDQTAVEGEDLLTLAAASKKKKKEAPVIDHAKVEYEPFRKDFYTEPSEITQMTLEAVAELRYELDGIKVKPDDGTVVRPVTKWAQMGLLIPTMDVFTKKGYTKPTSIQAQAIPIIESGRDLIGVAKTGSGKTLAFGLPMIRHVLDQRPLKSSDGPIGLILAPTRELALQIVKELKPFLAASNLTIKCAYGGAPISEQISMIKKGGIHLLCATPGRLIDLLQSNSGRVLSFRRITYVVLDEADRMFDMGFEPQVMKILASIRPDRQTILFSATMPKNIHALAKKVLIEPHDVEIGGRSKVAAEITQRVVVVEPSYEKKILKLLLHLGQLFSKDENVQVLIFTERQETAEDVLSKLIKAKYSAVNTIHGRKDQDDREEAIDQFKRGILAILIATSVAARGLDVPGLAMVYNFDCPTHLEDYVHRCGRTGRAGNKGTAITLIENPGQERYAVNLVKALQESGQDVADDLLKMANDFIEKVKKGEEKWFGGFGGKGLDKLDAARASERKREKQAHKLGDEDDVEDEPEIVAPKKPEVTGIGISNVNATATESEDQPAWMKVLDRKIVVQKTERTEDTGSSNTKMSAKERAMAAAKKIDGNLSKKNTIHAGQPIDNKGPDAGLYHSTIEINDFPQKARWAVTNRTNVAKILDATGVSITTKGQFYAPNNRPKEGDPAPLYILVEGDNENVVTQAMMEIQRHLREGTIMAEDASSARGAVGRYNVLD